jgi:hypothetical protein
MNHLYDLLEVLTVGLPFCVFKLIAGKVLFLHADMKILGGMLIVLGILDLIINLTNVVFLIVKKRRAATICTLTLLVKLWADGTNAKLLRMIEVAASLDFVLSFLLVVGMIDSGYIGKLPAIEMRFWNASVICNVLGAGLSQLSRSIRKLNEA